MRRWWATVFLVVLLVGLSTLNFAPTVAQTPSPEATPKPMETVVPKPASPEALSLESLQEKIAALEEKEQAQKVNLDTLWVLYTGVLVFFMNAGFCMLETGFCRQKNAVNILSKNLIVFALSTVSFWAIGFGIMFGDGSPFFGANGWFLQGTDNSPATGDAYQGIFTSLSWAGVPLVAKFFFQLVFAGTAATIVSGAVAERIKF